MNLKNRRLGCSAQIPFGSVGISAPPTRLLRVLGSYLGRDPGTCQYKYSAMVLVVLWHMHCVAVCRTNGVADAHLRKADCIVFHHGSGENAAKSKIESKPMSQLRDSLLEKQTILDACR